MVNNLPANAGDTSLILGPEIPYARSQLRPSATTMNPHGLEATLHNKTSHCKKKPAYCSEESSCCLPQLEKALQAAGTPERKFSTKQNTAFTTGLDLIKSLPSKLEGRMVVATGRPVSGEHPLALALCYQQAGLNLSSQTAHFPVL